MNRYREVLRGERPRKWNKAGLLCLSPLHLEEPASEVHLVPVYFEGKKGKFVNSPFVLLFLQFFPVDIQQMLYIRKLIYVIHDIVTIYH